MLSGSTSADTTVIYGGVFYSEIDQLLQHFTLFDCDLILTENAPVADAAVSQFSLYWRDQNDNLRTSTDDPLGADVLAAIDINGAAGGELSVFYPLTFIAPDTLLLEGNVVDVPRSDPGAGRLRFYSIAPNPARGTVTLSFELPTEGETRVRIYDIAGRLIAEPLDAKEVAGPGSLRWNARGRYGSRVAAGIYIAEIRFGPQTAVRRFVITR
jgi:Secretion system C-terminal sorting domain